MLYDDHQFRALAAEVDEAHHESMRTFRSEIRELHLGPDLRPSRRRFLQHAGVGGALITIGGSALSVTQLAPALAARARRGQEPTDTGIAAFAAGVELAAVSAYRAAVDTGKLDDTATAVGTLFARHHADHAAAFNGLVGDTVSGAGNQTVLEMFGPKIAAAPDQEALLGIAYAIEEAAASTYVFALGALQDPKAAGATATILGVESQHAAALATVLGMDLDDFTPPFETADDALDPARFPA